MPQSEMRRPLLPRLREADAILGEQALSAAAEERLQQLVSGGPPPRTKLRVSLAAAGLAAAACAALALLLWPRPAAHRAPGPVELAGFRVIAGDAAEDQRALRCASARCVLRAVDQRARLRLERGARVRRRSGDVQVVAGRLLCEVDPRAPRRRPFKMIVSHGAIEVLGTQFSVEQGERGGAVVLHHGAIRFVADSGEVVRLSPGERLVWPLPRSATAAPPTPAPQPTTTRPPVQRTARSAAPRTGAVDATADGSTAPLSAVESVLEEVERLRSQGRYAAAAARLRQGFEAADSEADRERLSYERGAILTDHLANARAACRHWAAHLARFGRRRYGALIDKARAQLRCPAGKHGGSTR